MYILHFPELQISNITKLPLCMHTYINNMLTICVHVHTFSSYIHIHTYVRTYIHFPELRISNINKLRHWHTEKLEFFRCVCVCEYVFMHVCTIWCEYMGLSVYVHTYICMHAYMYGIEYIWVRVSIFAYTHTHAASA